MGHLEEVHARKAPGEEPGVDGLLGIAGQEEPAAADLAEQDDRRIVDPGTGPGRVERNGPSVRPEDAKPDGVDRERIAGREDADLHPAVGEGAAPGGVRRAGPAHPVLEHAADAISLEEEREAADVVLVGMRQHDDVDPSVPRRDAGVECDEEGIGIGSAVDEKARAALALDEDRVALPDVEDRDADPPVGSRGRGDEGEGDGRREGDDREPGEAREAGSLAWSQGLRASARSDVEGRSRRGGDVRPAARCGRGAPRSSPADERRQPAPDGRNEGECDEAGQ
jgi:hypothetical protein